MKADEIIQATMVRDRLAEELEAKRYAAALRQEMRDPDICPGAIKPLER